VKARLSAPDEERVSRRETRSLDLHCALYGDGCNFWDLSVQSRAA
jgi:hypothetical protein